MSDHQIDLAGAEKAAGELLDALGIEHHEGTLAGTPGRIARAYAELLTPREFSLTTFPNDEGYDEMVIARDIPFTSVCEHHLLPFIGTAVVGYLPGDRIIGLSKLARVVELFARRPQVQERMTTQIARWLDDNLQPKGVGIVVQAEHTCMTIRGVGARGATTVTSTLLGHLRNDARTRAEFLALAEPR
jgi:GTP cyclohydrolase I